LDKIDDRIRVKLEDNLNRVFALKLAFVMCYSHCGSLVSFLMQQIPIGSSVGLSSLSVLLIHYCLSSYGDVNFNPLRGYPLNWDLETEVNRDRVDMATAALLHFNGSVADMVQWVGGPHVAQH
jgi:hypothetical protein